jgi:hypothetical protein
MVFQIAFVIPFILMVTEYGFALEPWTRDLTCPALI